MGIFNPHADLQDCNASLGPVDIFLAGGDTQMGMAADDGTDDLAQPAAQASQKKQS